nr:MAG: hypothetical protein DIU61_19790 [Bacteroidota bacterium]
MKLDNTQSKDFTVYRNHPAWISQRRFINRVRILLARLNVVNRLVDSVKLAQSIPEIDVEFINVPNKAYCGQIIKGKTNAVILLNTYRSEKARQLDCAHELGHFWFHPGVDDLHRYDVIHREIMELQAHWTARELKMPEFLFRKMVRQFRGSDEALVDFLSDFFFVTQEAIQVRLSQLRLWGAQRKPEVYLLLSEKAIKTNVTEDVTPVAQSMQMDEMGRVKKCVRCGNSDFASDGVFCKRCGMDLINHCTFAECNRTNSPDAAYCEWCGSETTFFVKGVINDWQGPYNRSNGDDFDPNEVPF